MSFPGFDHLYAVEDPISSRAFRGAFEPTAIAFEISRGELLSLPTVTIGWMMGGREPSDVIWTGMVAPLIVHQRVLDVLDNVSATGWTTYPVEVRNKDGRLVPRFFGLAICGRSNPVDVGRSEIVLKQMPGGWIPRFRGKYFEPTSWDGSDLFMERSDAQGSTSSWKFATDRVVRALTKARVRNLVFERLTDVEVDASNYTIGMQHRLPADYGDRLERAYRTAKVERPSWI